MDSRKQKNVSSGSKGRGRGVRSPHAYYSQQPTPQPYYPQQPTPQPYFPQPPTPHGYYPPPMQPREYVIDQTAELDFDPMLNYRDEVVPETQELPNDDDDVQEVQDFPTNKAKSKADKIAWTQDEEEALAKAWVHISTYRVVGNEQSRDKKERQDLKFYMDPLDNIEDPSMLEFIKNKKANSQQNMVGHVISRCVLVVVLISIIM